MPEYSTPKLSKISFVRTMLCALTSQRANQICLSFNMYGSFLDKESEAYGPRREKTCLRGFTNNTGADQPAHPRSLISAFVIRFSESTICTIAAGEITIC